MKTRTLLVDSSNLLKRSYHGAKDSYTLKFGHIGGLYQFFTTLRKLIKDYMINKVVLVWDGENGGVERHRIDNYYKSNRKTKEWYQKIELSEAEIRREKEKEESILKQRMRIKAYAEELFLRQIEVCEIEADDIIAAYCLQYNNKEEIFLYSQDRDFAQLLDLNITIIFPNIEQPVTQSNYLMYFSHHYLNALTMKIICGDKSDKVAGIKGIGEDTLLEHFPELQFKRLSVNDIYNKAKEINIKRVAEKKKPIKALENLLNGKERLKINFKLVNLREPMLNEEAREELKQLEMPLSLTNRGSKNLYRMMNEDEFLTIYKSTFVNYVQPFYTVIMNEKQLFEDYNKNLKKSL
jgi:5'-3' exonuclease